AQHVLDVRDAVGVLLADLAHVHQRHQQRGLDRGDQRGVAREYLRERAAFLAQAALLLGEEGVRIHGRQSALALELIALEQRLYRNEHVSVVDRREVAPVLLLRREQVVLEVRGDVCAPRRELVEGGERLVDIVVAAWRVAVLVFAIDREGGAALAVEGDGPPGNGGLERG